MTPGADQDPAQSQAGEIRVTVLVDTFNSGRYIEQAVGSVLEQDFPPEQFEILVVDDGSVDDTAERVRKMGDRVRYLRKPNGGQGSAFNYGFARARGEIVALLDGDDYWLPGKLRRVMDEFEAHPDAGMVYHNFLCREESSGVLQLQTDVAGFSGFLSASPHSLLRYDLFPTATLAFRRTALDQLLPVPERLIVQADAHLTACAIFLAPVRYIDQPLTVYRVHEENRWNCPANTPPGARLFRGDAVSRARLARRIVATRAIRVGVEQWLGNQGFDLGRSELRAFLMQWTIAGRASEFTLSPPGRWRFFRHLFEQGWYFHPRMSPRHLAVHCLNTLGSLVVGYRNFHLLDQGRLAAKRWLISLRSGR